MIQTTVTTLDVDGRQFPIRHPAGHSIEYMLNELFRKQVYPALTFLAPRMQVIFDVGANIGCASIWYRLHYPQAAIFAFEPDPTAFECLQANIGGMRDVQLFNFGIYSRDGKSKLFLGHNNTTTNSMGPSSHNTTASVEIDLRRLSSIIRENKVERISLLKLDTEGAEVPILQDIAADLEKVDAIQLEYHSERDRRDIDQLLADRFILVSAHIDLPHRGTVSYVAKDLLSSLTNLEKLQIQRP